MERSEVVQCVGLSCSPCRPPGELDGVVLGIEWTEPARDRVFISWAGLLALVDLSFSLVLGFSSTFNVATDLQWNDDDSEQEDWREEDG